jgi:hypothetical protein
MGGGAAGEEIREAGFLQGRRKIRGEVGHNINRMDDRIKIWNEGADLSRRKDWDMAGRHKIAGGDGHEPRMAGSPSPRPSPLGRGRIVVRRRVSR